MATSQTGLNPKDLVTRFLDILLEEGRDLNLFYCWEAALHAFPDFLFETRYLNTLRTLLLHGRNLEEQDSADYLAGILSNSQFLSVIIGEFDLLATFGLAGWWLYARHNRAEGLDAAWQFIIEITNSYPHLSTTLRSYLEAGKSGAMLPELVNETQQSFQIVMQQLREDMRLRSYRGVPLAIKIQRDNLVNRLEPIYEALEGSSSLPPMIVNEIETLTLEMLVDDHELQVGNVYPLEGQLLRDIKRDYESTLEHLKEALQLRLRLSGSSSEGVGFGDDERLQSDITHLLEEFPVLAEVIEAFINTGLDEGSQPL